MTAKAMIAVPYWVEEAFKRKNMSLADCLDYEKVRSVMSVNDVASFLAAQENAAILGFIKNNYLCHLLSSWRATAKAALWNELDSTVSPLSYSKEIAEDLILRLSSLYSNDLRDVTFAESNVTQKYFAISDFSRDAFGVVLLPGFVDAVRTAAVQKELIDAILKVFYVYYPVSKVSCTDVFATYLSLLSRSVTGHRLV